MSASLKAVSARLRAAGCVFAEDEARLLVESASSKDDLERMLAERERGRRLEYVLGWSDFLGVRVLVAPGVFVPRPRTALLVARAVALSAPGSVVVDLCCGTGAIGLAIATEVPGVRLFASDIDPVAVGCARDNLAHLGEVVEGDLLDALPPTLRGAVDVLVANAPYVPTDAIALMPREARDQEALVALDGGADGLDLHRRLAAAATQWLAPGGSLLVEASSRQAPLTEELFAEASLTTRVVHSKSLDATVVIGTYLEL